jgi:hypothetical protein
MQYGFYGLNNETTIFQNITLESPALNISAGFFDDTFFGADWKDPRTSERPFSKEVEQPLVSRKYHLQRDANHEPW